MAYPVQLERVVEESRTYGVRGEEGSLRGWGWEQKETDIYKVWRDPSLNTGFIDGWHGSDSTNARLIFPRS
jgi:hypothetical protein